MTSIKTELKNILFLDIETVAIKKSYSELITETQQLWASKANTIARSKLTEKEIEELYLRKAGVFAEFAKVICISVGYCDFLNNQKVRIKIKSYFGDNERQLLTSFSNLIVKYFNNPRRYRICGHNIKEFDIPFICRRMLINNVPIPDLLNLSGKKPWEVSYLLDTLHLWRFGDYKNYTSLDLLANVLNIPSPKDSMDGSMVHEQYFEYDNLAGIRKYCEKDVVTVAKVFLRMRQLDCELQI